MLEQIFKPGEESFFSYDSPIYPDGAVFEDDGETGYFYVLGLTRPETTVLDSVHFCNVAKVSHLDRATPGTALSTNGVTM